MIKRTISTLALWAVLILAIYYARGYGFAALIYILSVLASYEACELLKKCGSKPSFKAVAISETALFTLIAIAATKATLISPACIALLSILFIILAFSLWSLKDPFSEHIKLRVLPSFCVFMAVGVMLSLYAILAFSFEGCGKFAGVTLACWAIASAKFSDIGGYLFGASIGKCKLAPRVSPKKTWEGAIGGVVLSVLASYLILRFSTPLFEGALQSANLHLLTLVAAPIIAVFALISDLLESVLKRRANIKDSGATIPGIGGALDLADSMLLTAPISYLFAAFLIFAF